MKILYYNMKKISGYLICLVLAVIFSGCGIKNTDIENIPSESDAFESQTSQSSLTELKQSILQYEEKYAASEADAADLRTLAELYGQMGMVLRQRDLLEQDYRLFADEEALIQLKELTVNLAEENAAVKEAAQQLFYNLSTEGYLNEAISVLHSKDWFFTMMPKLTVGQRRYYMENTDGSTLCIEVGYDETNAPYSSVWLTQPNGNMLHLLKQETYAYLLETQFSDGAYQGAFETWLCLAESGDVYHEQGFFENGISIGEYKCEAAFGSNEVDLISLWNNREDFQFTDYSGEFDNFGKTTLTQPSSLSSEEVVYAYDASGDSYLILKTKEASQAVFDYALWGFKAYPDFTPYEVIQQEPVVSSGDAQVQIRIYDSNIEWFDGKIWHVAGTVEEYAAADPFRKQESSFPTDDSAIQESSGSSMNRGSGSNVVSTSPTTPTKKPSQTSTQKPVQTSPPAQTQSPDTAPSQTPTPAPAPAPVPTPAPAETPDPIPSPAPGTSGDGSDIEWSPDFE